MKNPKLIENTIFSKEVFSNITLRDIFAGMVMNGILSGRLKVEAPSPEEGVLGTCESFAEFSFEAADLMLKAREGK